MRSIFKSKVGGGCHMSTIEALPSRALGVLGGTSGCNITGL